MDHRKFLEKIMGFDENIRYGTICDDAGRVVCSSKREGVETYLSPEETEDTLQHAVSAWNSRKKHYNKIGMGLYTLAVYEKLRRATFPLKDGHMLLVTIGSEGGQKDIINRIINELYGDYTME